MSELKLTPEQERAIFASGHNILVSASAGSGKTFVMANRIVEKVKAGVSIQSLFISTFTKKAAAELRTRLERDLRTASRETDDDDTRHLLRLALQELPNADIGTMDSFTQKLLKTHFNAVHVDPNFKILADASEQDLIKAEVFDDLVESYLSESEELAEEDRIPKADFEKMMKNFSKDRNINGFQEAVYKLYYFANANEKPLEWLAQNFLVAFDRYRTFSDMGGQDDKEVREDLEGLFEALQEAIDEELLTAATIKKALPLLEEREALFNDLDKNLPGFVKRFFNANSMRKADHLKEVYYKVIGPKGGEGSARLYLEAIKHKALIEKYQPEARKVAEHLGKFTGLFYRTYLSRKLEMNSLEYGDVAHFAIKILSDFPEIAQFYQEKYYEIMIDEYQDTSHIQEAMLKLLSKNGDGTDNLFMVGDIKQSIYGFRQADPSLFYRKYKDYQEASNPHELIRLKENFRSRGEVLNFTNKIFQHLMDDHIGEMTYGDEEMLLQGNMTDYPEDLDESFYPEFLAYHAVDSGDEDKLTDGEIKIAAQRIKKLIQEEKIEPRDIAILVRSKSANNKIEDVLKAYDIPVVLDEGRQDFLKSIEVLVMLDVLRAIDNPLQDIPLVALLRSPLFQFNEDELTRISLQADRGMAFWLKVMAVIKGDMPKEKLITRELKAKIQAFYQIFGGWRKLSSKIEVHELLWKIYLDSYYFDYVGSLDNGELRQANLQALSSRAKSYEASGYKGLFRFIKLIESFMGQNNDLAAVNIKLPENAVRVMTFHKSKGLEFDHVFLMNLNKKFNMQDLNSDIILDREEGIGITYRADFKHEEGVVTEFPYALVKMDTFPYRVNREKKELASLSEEMRVLYVALTRAKKKLYLIGKLKDSKNKEALDEYMDAELVSGLLDDKYRRSSNGFQHWILAMREAVELPMSFDLIEDDGIESVSNQFIKKPEFEELLKSSKKFDDLMEQSEDIKQAKAIMEFNYPYPEATQLSSIQTPSQVKKRAYEKQIELGGIAPVSEYVSSKTLSLDFGQRKLGAAEIGTATHSFMQALDFHQVDLFSLQASLDEMNLSENLKSKIDIAKISSLFEQDFGKFLMEHAEQMHKEAPFSMLRTDDIAKEQYIVRGICDAFVLLKDRILLLDYKTDRFKSSSEIPEIMQRYELQMRLYAEALSKAYAVKQVDRYLILLGGPDQVWVEKYDEL